ncbi:MAG: hypothetical protein ACI4JW_03310 [Oscillospiraceae bacterium]
MNEIINKIKALSIRQRVQLFTAVFLTIAVVVAIPVYAWFSSQRKAAEMYKLEYPNSLYINAAHREDRMYFGLDAVDVNDYVRDDNGEPVKDGNGDLIAVTEKKYVFTVSGSNAERFILQMAHTNNNLFKYEIYEASQYDYLSENAPEDTDPDKIVPSGTSADNIIEYQTNPDGYNENPLVFASDPVNKTSSETKYYVIGSKIDGKYLNNANNEAAVGEGNLANNNDKYYSENYGANTNVESHAVPSYWQAALPANPDANKQFCRYFVLRVTWDTAEQDTNKKKETDMIYFSAQRTS